MLKYLLLLVPLLAWAQDHDEKKVIGLDQRIQVKNLNDPFHRTVGVLIRQGGGFCTATLIDSHHILTSAHCVVKKKSFPTSVESPLKFTFVPGMLNGPSDRPYREFRVRRIDTFREFVQQGRTSHDIAVLELATSPMLPTIRRIKVENINIENKVLVITGYSSQKAQGTMWEGRGITRDANPATNLITHDVDTLPGTSGALLRISTAKGWVAIGVHRGPVGLLNNAVYFTPEVFDAINRWIKN